MGWLLGAMVIGEFEIYLERSQNSGKFAKKTNVDRQGNGDVSISVGRPAVKKIALHQRTSNKVDRVECFERGRILKPLIKTTSKHVQQRFKDFACELRSPDSKWIAYSKGVAKFE
jgi:hypothetical protein